MKDYILRYDGKNNKKLKKIAEADWKQEVLAAPEHIRDRLAFMTADHHAVRYFAVRQLPRNNGRPLTPEQIAKACSLPVERARAITEELETHLFFLVRDGRGDVSWAFPVTVDQTPHALTFNLGERLFGA